MSGPTPPLPALIERALSDGVSIEDVERELLDPARLPSDEHDALWLYALARRDCPRRADVALVAGN